MRRLEPWEQWILCASTGMVVGFLLGRGPIEDVRDRLATAQSLYRQADSTAQFYSDQFDSEKASMGSPSGSPVGSAAATPGALGPQSLSASQVQSQTARQEQLILQQEAEARDQRQFQRALDHSQRALSHEFEHHGH